VMNTTSADGSPCTNGAVKSEDVPMHGYDQSITVEIPPFSVMYFTVKKAPVRKKTVKKDGGETKAKTTKTTAKKAPAKKTTSATKKSNKKS
ncbi:MAG: 1,4-alpha-glucan branching enzyme, partial [Oscillospiraceae bacterium]|nr:1,4-alpha-glucan branching enzyme [Oscillospiraceae bacterium]